MKFEDLNLHPTLLKAVKDQNYTHPTAIQQQAIPLILKKILIGINWLILYFNFNP